MPDPRFIDWIKEKLKVGEAELVDKWLETHKGMGIVCEKEVMITFPIEHPKAPEAFEELLMETTAAFGGATYWDGAGTWCVDGPCSSIIKEKNKVIFAAHHCTDERKRERFANALKKAESETEQTAVGIKGTNRFYIIPTEHLKP